MAGRRLILDSGAVSALVEKDERAFAWFTLATQKGYVVGVPAPVLAESMTGRPSDAELHRLLRPHESCIATTAKIAITAGTLRFRSGATDKTVDALVVASATEYPGSIVLTGDKRDIERLAAECESARIKVRSVNSKVG